MAASLAARGMLRLARAPAFAARQVPLLARAASGKTGGKSRLTFVCTDCGMDTTKWVGQCPSCKAWNTLKEFRPPPELASPSGMAARLGPTAASAPSSRGWDVTGSRMGGSGGALGGPRLVPISEYAEPKGGDTGGAGRKGGSSHARVATGAPEVDRVLGGGLVPGSVVLLAGAPGIGKSTLVLQLARSIAGASGARGRVAYVAGEESPAQIARRAVRLNEAAEAEGAEPGALSGVEVLHETSLDGAIDVLLGEAEPDGPPADGGPAGPDDRAVKLPFDAIIVDSIQTMYLDGVTSAAGTVSQVRECALRLLQLAKASAVPVILVGHMTKAGEVAGPRVLEHLVDAVVLLEGEGAGTARVRVLRSAKNRFGATSEVALLMMSDAGLREVDDPAAMFLSPARARALREMRDGGHAGDGSAAVPPGSAVTATLEGRRALCVEIEALCSGSASEWPRHRASGVPIDRVHMLLAVLAKHAGVRVGRSDVHLSVAGGIRLRDPVSEAAVAAALASSALDVPIAADTAVLGEVALSGELRAVAGEDERLRALAALGFGRVVLPLDSSEPGRRPKRSMARPDGGRMRLERVRDIRGALGAAMGHARLSEGRRAKRSRAKKPRARTWEEEEEADSLAAGGWEGEDHGTWEGEADGAVAAEEGERA